MWDYGLMYEINLNVTGKIIRSLAGHLGSSATGPLPLASKNCITSFLTPIAAVSGLITCQDTMLLLCTL